MAEIIRCPDCGGVVGAQVATDEGPPCTCFGQPGFKTASEDSGGTQVMDSLTQPKVCCRCGKDLNGKKRLKDSLGYWCPECHREDQKKNEPQGVKCENCGRVVPVGTLTGMDGKQVCSRCIKEQRALRAPGSKKFRAISDNSYKKSDKRSVVILAIVMGLLALVILVSHFLK